VIEQNKIRGMLIGSEGIQLTLPM